MSPDDWTQGEKKLARRAFDIAVERDYQRLFAEVRRRAGNVYSRDSVWMLRDFLDEKGREFDEKYDYRYSRLDLLFVRLVREKLLTYEDLQGFSENRMAYIRDLAEWTPPR